jgi:endonuclease/exonuclease/phosphatase family metal-dependent hydrolase
MAASLRKFSRNIFVFSNLVVVFLLLLCCANGYLNPWQWWFIALLGFGFHVLLALNLFYFVYWCFRKSKWAFLSLAAILIAWTNFRAAIGISFGKPSAQKTGNTIRLLTWNVHLFGVFNPNKGDSVLKPMMIDFIKEQDADIVCLQEFYEDYGSQKRKGSVFDALAQMGLKYSVYAEDYGQPNGPFSMGIAIFSRYPFADSLRLRYKDRPGPIGHESLLSVDIRKNDKLFRVFTTHLQSYQFEPRDYETIQSIKGGKTEVYSASKSVIRKLRHAYQNRVGQAELVRTQLDNSRIPELICGDFNDIPNSYTYFHIKGDRQDAFAKKGSGIGRTFAAISPTLRIDYVFADKQFKVLRYERKTPALSDHYPVIVDLELP